MVLVWCGVVWCGVTFRAQRVRVVVRVRVTFLHHVRVVVLGKCGPGGLGGPGVVWCGVVWWAIFRAHRVRAVVRVRVTVLHHVRAVVLIRCLVRGAI